MLELVTVFLTFKILYTEYSTAQITHSHGSAVRTRSDPERFLGRSSPTGNQTIHIYILSIGFTVGFLQYSHQEDQGFLHCGSLLALNIVYASYSMGVGVVCFFTPPGFKP